MPTAVKRIPRDTGKTQAVVGLQSRDREARRWLRPAARLIVTGLFAGLLGCSQDPAPTPVAGTATPAPATPYVPQPVWCADGSGALCSLIPSFIGPDPAIQKNNGYQGLSNDVTSARFDAQTPFDNMAWQMFIALNWQASQPGGDPKTALSGAGPTVWQTYAQPEDLFDGPSGDCPNPNKLPRFNLIAKSGAQGSRDEEFIQATGQPLIDVNGNWALYERHLNSVEQNYLQTQGLTTYAGQQSFIQAGNTVEFPPGDDSKPNGQVGAIEIKAAWRIISAEEQASYFNIQGLIDVQGAYVRDGQPLCAQVTLGLVGLHIVQNNPEFESLRGQSIWASFEHKNNAPIAAAACAPTDPNCYKTITNNLCPAATNAGDYSFSRNACSAVTPNTPPALAQGESAFIWERQPPYAQSYLTQSNGASCGTQVAHCWQVYDLTQQLNSAWQAQLSAINSVFANYYLIGTNWGGFVEPDGTQLDNQAVPAFLANSTLETFIQADPEFGNCVGCHKSATLAYTETDPSTGKVKHFPADFSFLPGLANQQSCSDLSAGPIFSNDQAQTVCPAICSAVEDSWNGQWTTTVFGVMSVCGCCG
jgi:hypothetical protein